VTHRDGAEDHDGDSRWSGCDYADATLPSYTLKLRPAVRIGNDLELRLGHEQAVQNIALMRWGEVARYFDTVTRCLYAA
jgi:hypothetical protein